MRIIAGKYKSRTIPTISGADYRPSTTKFRAALFSILGSGEFIDEQPILNARVLDLFAGSGALAFEALSRGAKFATLVDINSNYLQNAENFAKKIGEVKSTEFITANALNLPSFLTNKYDMVFIDPPYQEKLVDKSLSSLIRKNLLHNGSLIVVEVEKSEQIKFSKDLVVIKERIYSRNKLLIFRYEQN